MVSMIRYRGYMGYPSESTSQSCVLSSGDSREKRLYLMKRLQRMGIYVSTVPDPVVYMVQYEVRVTTGKIDGAGTDANVYIAFFGTNGECEKIQLTKTSQKPFQLGETDCFVVALPVGLGELTKLRIEHDDTGLDAAWFLDCVHVTNRKTLMSKVYLCNEWLDNEQGTSRELWPEDSCDDDDSISSHSTRTPSPERNHLRQREPPKRRLHVDLSPITLETDIAGLEPDPAMVQYEILVATGNIYGAGTDANVYISVFGTRGKSGKLQLTKKYTNVFERGRTDRFIMNLPDDLGELTKLRIEHDDTGLDAAWFLDSVHVINRKTLMSKVYHCNEWLDNQHGTSRELWPVDSCDDDDSISSHSTRCFSSIRRKLKFCRKFKRINRVFRLFKSKKRK